jgi:hypothetical protein
MHFFFSKQDTAKKMFARFLAKTTIWSLSYQFIFKKLIAFSFVGFSFSRLLYIIMEKLNLEEKCLKGLQQLRPDNLINEKYLDSTVKGKKAQFIITNCLPLQFIFTL